jgi:ribosomal 50S subunit-associated protein YjgA (DUF615 family)
MHEPENKVVVLEQFVGKIRDVHNSYAVLIEKLAKVQADAAQAGLDAVASGLAKPFSDASADAESIHELLRDTEMERNKRKAAA